MAFSVSRSARATGTSRNATTPICSAQMTARARVYHKTGPTAQFTGARAPVPFRGSGPAATSMTARRTLRLSCQAQQQQHLVEAAPGKTVLGFVGIGIMGLAMVRLWGSWAGATRGAPWGALGAEGRRSVAKGDKLFHPGSPLRQVLQLLRIPLRSCSGKPICVLPGSIQALLTHCVVHLASSSTPPYACPVHRLSPQTRNLIKAGYEVRFTVLVKPVALACRICIPISVSDLPSKRAQAQDGGMPHAAGRARAAGTLCSAGGVLWRAAGP